MEILIIALTLGLVVTIFAIGYIQYKQSKKTSENLSQDMSNIAQAVSLSDFQVTNLSDFTKKLAIQTLGVEHLSSIVKETYENTSFDKFIHKLKSLTGAKLELQRTSYSYGEMKYLIYIGVINKEKFVLFCEINSREVTEDDKKEFQHPQEILPYLRKKKVFSTDVETNALKEVEVEYYIRIHRINLYTTIDNVHVKAERIEKAFESSVIHRKEKPKVKLNPKVFTLSWNPMTKSLSLTAVSTNRLTYNFDHMEENYETIDTNILQHKIEMQPQEALNYVLAGLQNKQNAILVGPPGIGKTAFTNEIMRMASNLEDEKQNPIFRVIILDAINIDKLSSNEFANVLKGMANDEDNTINLIVMEDAEALIRKSFDENGNKTDFASFFFSMLDGTYQRMYNLVWMITSNENVHEISEIVQRRFNIVMPFKKLTLAKAEAKAKSIEKTLSTKQVFNWSIWNNIKNTKTEFALSDIYGCIQPVSTDNAFYAIQKRILEKHKIDVVETVETVETPKTEPVKEEVKDVKKQEIKQVIQEMVQKAEQEATPSVVEKDISKTPVTVFKRKPTLRKK